MAGTPERPGELNPIVPFPELWRDSLVVSLLGASVRIASIPHLIQMKQLAGRTQDLADIEVLRRILAQNPKS